MECAPRSRRPLHSNPCTRPDLNQAIRVPTREIKNGACVGAITWFRTRLHSRATRPRLHQLSPCRSLPNLNCRRRGNETLTYSSFWPWLQHRPTSIYTYNRGDQHAFLPLTCKRRGNRRITGTALAYTSREWVALGALRGGVRPHSKHSLGVYWCALIWVKLEYCIQIDSDGNDDPQKTDFSAPGPWRSSCPPDR